MLILIKLNTIDIKYLIVKKVIKKRYLQILLLNSMYSIENVARAAATPEMCKYLNLVLGCFIHIRLLLIG